MLRLPWSDDRRAEFASGRTPDECVWLVEQAGRETGLLVRRTGPSEFVVGNPHAWRSRPALRGEVDPDGTVRTYVQWSLDLVILPVVLAVALAAVVVQVVRGEIGAWRLSTLLYGPAYAGWLVWERIRMDRHAAYVRRVLSPR